MGGISPGNLGRARLLRLIWPFAAVVLVQVALAIASLYTMSAVRAYVGGESLWSKGQKDAIYFLGRYAESREDRYFELYEAAVAVPLADGVARVVMQRRGPSAQAHEAFLQAGNDPADVPALVWLFENFQEVSYFARSIELWVQGDVLIAELTGVAAAVRAELTGGSPSADRIDVLKAEIEAINQRIGPLALAFSASLGEASRVIRNILMAGNLFTAFLLIALVLWRTRKLLQQREAFEAALHAERERVQLTLASIGDAVISTGADGLLDYMNPAAEALLGWNAADAVGKPLPSLFRILHEEGGGEDTLPLAKLLEGRAWEAGAVPRLLIRPDLTAVPVTVVGTPLRTGGMVGGAVIVLHDKTSERDYIQRLSWQASHDALTELANRRCFEERLERAMAGLSEHPRNHALMFLDLDQFKLVNDTCGHAAGDQLLREVSAVLLCRLGATDMLARLGGDEFGILLDDRAPAAAAAVAEELRQAVSELAFAWNGQVFAVTASIGLVHVARATETPEEVLRAADVACYMAKEKGRNRVQVHSPGDSELQERFGEMAWVQRIQQGLEQERFCLYAQEIVALAEDVPSGTHLEVLVRLRDEGGRLVQPGSFLPPAERYGMMPAIDRWVLRKTFATLAARLADPALSGIETCAINLSGATLSDEGFIDYVRGEFVRWGVPPRMICFEVTETGAIANLAVARRFITGLQALGCRFSLDDFGTGMSSFAYLKHLPVDYLKIDGGFVRDMMDSRIDRAMVEMIAHMGQVAGKRTVAEFVENEETIRLLREIGIDYAQGFAIAAPRPFLADSLFRIDREGGKLQPTSAAAYMRRAAG